MRTGLAVNPQLLPQPSHGPPPTLQNVQTGSTTGTSTTTKVAAGVGIAAGATLLIATLAGWSLTKALDHAWSKLTR